MKTTTFANRHIGVGEKELPLMLKKIGVKSLDELIDKTIPANIRLKEPLKLGPAMTEREFATHIGQLAAQNKLYKTYIGCGWYDTVTPAVIQRNVFENPVWYTSYTPYQAEISQGRLEALLNFQTVISDLTAMPLANCSLLDEATAAAEAATMMHGLRSRAQQKAQANVLFVDEEIFPQDLAVIRTRAIPQGITVKVGSYKDLTFTPDMFGCIVQYPNNSGSIEDYRAFTEQAHAAGCKVAVAADILALAIVTPPGEWGADIVFGSSQRLGVPMFYGGPSAAYFATRDEYKRNMPGRIIGLSKDKYGRLCYRMALQTREQHIKREKATSNICTAQALLATMSGFYAVYHGPEGIREIAEQVHAVAVWVAEQLVRLGYKLRHDTFFDTLRIQLPDNVTLQEVRTIALGKEINLRYFDNGDVGISVDETTTSADAKRLVSLFAVAAEEPTHDAGPIPATAPLPELFQRKSAYLTHEVFNKYHTETEMMRYIKRLERKDISLAHSMISLGSCTMKLNAAAELLPLSNAAWMNVHPLVPDDQAAGYQTLIHNLCEQLKTITGFAGVSLQPNSGAAGEYTGLRVIRSYLESIGQGHRHLVLIPASAHGTNPASAVQAGYEPLTCACDEHGNVDLNDLREKAEAHKDELAALMITYPSTHGIFEEEIKEICQIIHSCGAQVYMDGANMNGQVGLTNPGTIGADLCHLNLHKTFASPHGGGGPGVGPICVSEHLVPFLPGHVSKGNPTNEVSAAPYGSAGILPITYGYICMMGAEGLKRATQVAIHNANYLAACLKDAYGVVYCGKNGFVGHEMILECRKLHEESGISENDISKRLMDYGYHAPTLSFPVHGTLMIEPTESESKAELDNFINVMVHIREEIAEIESGEADKEDNVLVNSPHPEYEIVGDNWTHPYSREKAAYPIESVRENKFWINVARIDNTLGDRKLLPTRYGSFE
ncbi:aminomethyl-transferring glycine dehydrogenase [Bacteroides mediterraneensis]|uniref:aminomethyl-transferring glycine dehydrogenase n=1 Tax=Bacteroides mediterraneensis TaxID=1841856 RepID=UPI00195CD6E6|nr:aminomethyl-transferring glycine dehydrogenase [Bacteroides mediterraneensis]MBM6781409.1 aminomethyl-transferring glycine dehydrogenase [Bacteroides mediterraneensis]